MSHHIVRRLVALLAISFMVFGFDRGVVAAPKKHIKPPPEQDSFIDQLQSYDTSRWMKADGWKNGSPFNNAWLADHISFVGGRMVIRLDDEGAIGEPYSSGNYQSLGFYGYGCYEASLKPAAGSGTVTSFFTYAGPFDNGGNGKHNEIDIEFLGKDTTSVQFNFFTNDDEYASHNEFVYDLGYDASEDFYVYAFKWSADGIEWYVDGKLVYFIEDSPTNPTPKATDSLQKIMMNLWPVDQSAEAWAGIFDYQEPLNAEYEWVRFTRGEDCEMGPPPEEPPLPPGDDDPDSLLVANISLNLVSRNTQVIARVAVVDGTGQPAVGATVKGAWSGVITKGDTSRVTDADGLATFYSARSRTAGEVEFCVIDITRVGSTFNPDASLENCHSIEK
jgi:endo-1,3-1,4-beta-glycanase ExoK